MSEREERRNRHSRNRRQTSASARANKREIERLSIFLRRTVCGLPECFYCMPKISCCSLYWTSNSQLLLFLIWAALVFSNSFFISEGVERIFCFFFVDVLWSFPCLRSLLLLLHLFFCFKMPTDRVTDDAWGWGALGWSTTALRWDFNRRAFLSLCLCLSLVSVNFFVSFKTQLSCQLIVISLFLHALGRL